MEGQLAIGEPFRLTGKRWDSEEVRPFLARYSELREEGVFYNADFKGRIPGLEDSPDEDRAIYLLSTLWSIEREKARIRKALADGYRPVAEVWTPTKAGDRKRFASIITYKPGYYSGGTGLICEYEDARLVVDEDGNPRMVLPKGKRSHGFEAGAGRTVLVRS